MKNQSTWFVWMSCNLLAAVLVQLVAVAQLRAEDTGATDDEQAEGKKLNERIEKAVDWYAVYVDSESKEPLKPVPVLRWRNAARGQEGEAMMVFWAWQGRPVAMASIYPWAGMLHHEFGSLSRAGKLVARDGEALVWSPAKAGIEFKDVPDSPEPAEAPAARLRQMRSIAQRFNGTMTGWKADNSDREELRLLPHPLYRYKLIESSTAHPNLIDGVAYAYAMGNDPEIVLLLEAVVVGGQSRWQYGLARATSGGLEARLDGKVVWVGEKFPPTNGRNNAEITLGRPLEIE